MMEESKSSVEVRNQIVEAFKDVPIPKREQMIASEALDKEGIRVIERNLTGKRWSDLPLNFLEQQWTFYYHLSAHAYQYYLPAILIAALDNFDSNSTLVHTVVWLIKPSEWAIYDAGLDGRLEYHVEFFTPEQFAAVGAFLGLMLKQPQNYMAFLAARAFRLGWDRVDSPERARFAEFHSEMRDWTYPEKPYWKYAYMNEPDDEIAGYIAEVIALKVEIAEAFAGTPYPGDDKLCGSIQWDEPAESALDFRGVSWQKAHPRLLAANYVSLSFLSPEGFRFYLPAYLTAELMGFADESNAQPDFSLTHGFSKPVQYEVSADLSFDKIAELLPGSFTVEQMQELFAKQNKRSNEIDWRADGKARMARFNRKERLAIIHYLEHRAKYDDFSANAISEALESYWRPSLEELPN